MRVSNRQGSYNDYTLDHLSGHAACNRLNEMLFNIPEIVDRE